MNRPNVLTVLGVHRKEDVVSNILVHFYNSAAHLRSDLLTALRVPQSPALLSGHARTRVGAGDAGIPDIVVVGRQSRQHALLIIENKIGAGEGKSQTERYASSVCRAELAARYGLDPDYLDVYYRYLTLFPNEKPEAEVFETVTYEALIGLESKLAADPSSWAPELMSAWLELVRDFYDSANLAPDREILSALGSDLGLEGNFLLFCRLMESLKTPQGLSYWGAWRGSHPGRRYFLAQFGKDSWAPEEMRKHGRKWSLDAKACFNIHIEPQYNVLGGNFAVYLHYETNPYQPLRWLRVNVVQHDFEAYNKRRDAFIRNIRSSPPGGLRIGGRNNQIGKVQFSLEGLTLKQAKAKLSGVLATLTTAVDDALAALP